MKKISCIIVTVILLMCTAAGCSKPEGTRKLSDIVSEKVQDIAVVNIISGNTGEIKSYKEADDIDKITAYMQNVMCTKSSPASASGWRANASYFYIAKSFVRDEIDVEILEELLSLGGLGIQYCIKSELAYTHLYELEGELISVEFNDFNIKYNQRDISARKKMKELIDSDANKVTNVFSTLL